MASTSLLNTSDLIRSHAARYVALARARGESSVTIIAGDIVRELNLKNLTPSVCNALIGKKFMQENALTLIKAEGPPSGLSTTMRYTYQLEGMGTGQAYDSSTCTPLLPRNSGFMSLRGAGKETWTSLGGGEAYLKQERAEFGS